jgi:hypothetical protein
MTKTQSRRWKLPGNKTLIGLDGKPTDDRRSWEHDRWEYVTSLPGFEDLDPNGQRVLRHIVRNPSYAHGGASMKIDQREVAKALGLSRKVTISKGQKDVNGRRTVGRQLQKILNAGLLEADPLVRGKNARWKTRVYHLVGIEAPRWHRPEPKVPRRSPTEKSHGEVPGVVLQHSSTTEPDPDLAGGYISTGTGSLDPSPNGHEDLSPREIESLTVREEPVPPSPGGEAESEDDGWLDEEAAIAAFLAENQPEPGPYDHIPD